MPVALSLNLDLYETFAEALKNKNVINLNGSRRDLQITSENLLPCIEAVKALHAKRFKQKTKTSDTLRTCYNCEQILKTLEGYKKHFPALVAANDEAANDDDLTDSDGETKPVLDQDWFDTAEAVTPESGDNDNAD